ncbi:dTMP kinase [Ruminiclostridium cellulolyticum]|uniref:Thymidylate kinase n=1 Tax=Ruminiclostridium cellulolyticum (strain ATCC 35319 / DSM 5812 / JCM 6584 / H10) TaxID=394503 RepID=B8I4J0_RUMCH|nr:dTMP kinase [Ruminiclostridium cellulolyticum]ACL74544.1 thymidylate kinase [Ruminiclostridium cellulolyticum H10]
MRKGLFITVEGTDGSGKTTQIKLMEQYLKDMGNEVVLSREPGGTRISEMIRDLILDPENKDISPLTEMMLYAAARAQHVSQVIRPAIESGKSVICDRFVDSSYAYQGCGRGVDLKTIADVNRAAIDGVVPDITFFLDLDPRVAMERRVKSTGADRIEQEKMDFHIRVYEGYERMALLYPERIKTIDASKSIEEISSQINIYLKEIL